MKPTSKLDLPLFRGAAFDCFNTLLFPEDYPFLTALAAFAQVSVGDLQRSLKALKPLAETGQLTPIARIERAIESLGQVIAPADAAAYADLELEVMSSQSTIYPGVEEALAFIRRYVKTAIVSNAHHNNRAAVLNKGLGQMVDFPCFSSDSDIQSLKPDPLIYFIASEKMGPDCGATGL